MNLEISIIIDGGRVSIAPNHYDIPAGQYLLRYEAHEAWSLVSFKTGHEIATCLDELRSLIAANILHRVDPAAIARELEFCRIRAASPMRPVHGRTADVDGLALFDAVRSPCLI